MEWAGIGLRASSTPGGEKEEEERASERAGSCLLLGVAVPQRKSDFNATPEQDELQGCARHVEGAPVSPVS